MTFYCTERMYYHVLLCWEELAPWELESQNFWYLTGIEIYFPFLSQEQ